MDALLPARRAGCIPSPPAAACSPSRTSSRCSTRGARRRRTSPPPSSRRSSTRRSPALRRGRRIKGKVLFLGGPLYFLQGLRRAFRQTLGLDEEHAVFPENAPLLHGDRRGAVRRGHGRHAPCGDRAAVIRDARGSDDIVTGEPLFTDRAEYDAFVAPPQGARPRFRGHPHLPRRRVPGHRTAARRRPSSSSSRPTANFLYQHYQSNNGQPLDIVVERLREIYALSEGRVRIAGRGDDRLRRGPEH